MPCERIVIEDDEYGRLLVQREPAPELVFRGCGPERGEWEDEARRAPGVEYLPPGDRVKVVLEAFGGKLRSDPMDWPENSGPRIALALDLDGDRFWDVNGRKVVDEPNRPVIGEFVDTGRYSDFGDRGGRVYVLVSVR